MRLQRQLAAVFLVLLVKLMSSPAQADLIWGVNGHPFTAYPGIAFDQQLDFVKDLGMTSYRVNISSITQTSRLGRLIEFAKPRGIDILPVLTPNLDLEKSSTEDLYRWSRAFAVYLVSRFKDDIRVWELGNELEIYAIIKPCEMRDDGTQYNCEWGPAGGVGPLDYYGPRWAKVSAVLKGLSDGTKSVDPTIRKAMGTAGWGHVGAFERMHDDGIAWDISVWHMYGEDPEWAFKKLAEYEKPIWVTELNHPHGSRDGTIAQAKGLKQSMQRLRELQDAFDVEAAHIYELLDEPYWAPNWESVMGLVYLEKNERNNWKTAGPKPAYCVVRNVVRGGYQMARPASGKSPVSAAPATAQRPSPRRACDLCLFDPQKPTARNKIAYSFCLALGREADGHGLASWAREMEKGRGIRDILLSLMASDEFARTHRVEDMSDAGYVTFIYRLLLDRDPDGQGHADYTRALDQGDLSRLAFVSALLESREFEVEHRILFLEEEAKVKATSAQ